MMKGMISNNSIYTNEGDILNIDDIVIFTMSNNSSFVCVIDDIFLDEEEQEIMIGCDTKETIYLSDVKNIKKY